MLNKKKLKRELLAKAENFLDIKIAVLSGSSFGELADWLEIFLLEQGIRPTFFFGDYNRYYEDALYSEALAKFCPDVIYIYTTNKNILNWPKITDSIESAGDILEKEFGRWCEIWDTCFQRFSCAVIQNNFDMPTTRPFGNLDSVDPRGRLAFINALNSRISGYAMEHTGFYVQDIAYLSAQQGLSNWYDASYMYLYKYAVSVPSAPALAKSVSFILASLYGKRKKCIVLDLDNTLWGGVIGEVGCGGIEVGMETPIGEAFSNFQRYIKDIADTGVLLCVASKNEESVARSGFNAAGMVLKEQDFVCFYANWGMKSDSIKKMAEELNLGLNSFVFIDDNPAERELVKSALPEVAVLDASEPEEFIKAIEMSGFFEMTAFSSEDSKRTQFYKDNQSRKLEKASFSNYQEFLKSLDMSCILSRITSENVERASQLIGKTNQFNLTGMRLTASELSDLAGDASWVCLCGSLADKFGDNGLVTVCMGKFDGDVFRIRLWVMSCRVFSRHLEYTVFDELVRLCRERGVVRIEGAYKPTAKNKPVAGLFDELGFRYLTEDGGYHLWDYMIPDVYKKKNNVMVVENT